MSPQPTDQTADAGDESAAAGIQRDHSRQHQCQHNEGCASLPIPMDACVQEPGDANEQRESEEDPAGL